jgi:hypothetical protein
MTDIQDHREHTQRKAESWEDRLEAALIKDEFVVVRVTRLGPPVYFGPFLSRDDAFGWLADRKLAASVIVLTDPTLDTTAGSEVWS